MKLKWCNKNLWGNIVLFYFVAESRKNILEEWCNNCLPTLKKICFWQKKKRFVLALVCKMMIYEPHHSQPQAFHFYYISHFLNIHIALYLLDFSIHSIDWNVVYGKENVSSLSTNWVEVRKCIQSVSLVRYKV